MTTPANEPCQEAFSTPCHNNVTSEQNPRSEVEPPVTKNMDNPLPSELPELAGKVRRYESVTLRIPAPVAICQELIARIKGVPPLNDLNSIAEYRSSLHLPLLSVLLIATALSTLVFNPILVVAAGISIYLGSTLLPRLQKQAEARAALEFVQRFSHDELAALALAAKALQETSPIKDIIEELRADRTSGLTYDLSPRMTRLQALVAEYLIQCEAINSIVSGLQNRPGILGNRLGYLTPRVQLQLLRTLRFFLSTDTQNKPLPLHVEYGRPSYSLGVELMIVRNLFYRSSAIAAL